MPDKSFEFFGSMNPKEGSPPFGSKGANKSIRVQSGVAIISDSKKRVYWLVSGPFDKGKQKIVDTNDSCRTCHFNTYTNPERDTYCHPDTDCVSDSCGEGQVGPLNSGYEVNLILREEGPRGDAICPHFGKRYGSSPVIG